MTWACPLTHSCFERFQLARHPAIEDLASTGSNTPQVTVLDPRGNNYSNYNSVNHSPTFGENSRLASFDSGAASVVPPTLPFGRMLSIEAPPAEQPGASTSSSPSHAVESSSSSNSHQQQVSAQYARAH